jgi:hypothetical protein
MSLMLMVLMIRPGFAPVGAFVKRRGRCEDDRAEDAEGGLHGGRNTVATEF